MQIVFDTKTQIHALDANVSIGIICFNLNFIEHIIKNAL